MQSQVSQQENVVAFFRTKTTNYFKKCELNNLKERDCKGRKPKKIFE